MGAPVSCSSACSVIVKVPCETVGSSDGVFVVISSKAAFSSILSFVYCIEITSTIEGTFLTPQ